jgi:hypothetical protein
MVLPVVDSRRHDRRRTLHDSISRIHYKNKNCFRVCFAFVFISALVLNQFKIPRFGAKHSEQRSSLFDQKDSILPSDDQRRNNVERAIFYNIFVPQNIAGENSKPGFKSKRDYAMDLVEEQLQYYSAASDFVRTTSIYYTLIGDVNATKDVARICDEVTTRRSTDNVNDLDRCHLLRSVEHGDEGMTLESLYDYCGNHPQSQVTYLHNKGSFHPSPENTAMRRMLTKSVFSDACQAMPIDKCTVCAARFSPLPHTHMSGNMWTADCSYVNKLIHPLQFSSKMDHMIKYSLALNDESVFPMPRRKYFDRPSDYGLKRFSFEYWVGSHPKLKPCDVYPDSAYAYGFLNLDTTATTIPPRVAVRDSSVDSIDSTSSSTSNTSSESGWKPILRRVPWIPLEIFWHWSFNEWFCGRGRLAQYKFLYGVYPDADSFLWSYYENPIKVPFKNFYSLMDRGCPIPIRKSDYL